MPRLSDHCALRRIVWSSIFGSGGKLQQKPSQKSFTSSQLEVLTMICYQNSCRSRGALSTRRSRYTSISPYTSPSPHSLSAPSSLSTKLPTHSFVEPTLYGNVGIRDVLLERFTMKLDQIQEKYPEIGSGLCCVCFVGCERNTML